MPNTEFPASDPRHGTPAGYNVHTRRRETPCQPCGDANRERNQKQRAAAKEVTDPHRAYVCSEVEFLSGTDNAESIAVRLGYGEFDYLRTVLKRWRRSDLVDQLERTRVAA